MGCSLFAKSGSTYTDWSMFIRIGVSSRWPDSSFGRVKRSYSDRVCPDFVGACPVILILRYFGLSCLTKLGGNRFHFFTMATGTKKIIGKTR